jgi:hypothetical protein
MEVIQMLAPFLNYVHEFYLKKVHMMLILMFDYKFKDVLKEIDLSLLLDLASIVIIGSR